MSKTIRLTESELVDVIERFIDKPEMNEQLLRNILSRVFKSGAKPATKIVKSGAKPATKMGVPLKGRLPNKTQQKVNLVKKGVQVLKVSELPKKFYHGTSSKLNLNNVNVSSSGKKISSAADQGMYFTENLWSNLSKSNKYKNPVYGQGQKSVGVESAEKYAQDSINKGKLGYIYEMELTPNAIVIPEGSIKGVNVARISPEQMKNLTSQGIDAIYRKGQELVILNKNAIKSFNLRYVADKFVGKQVKNSFGDMIPLEGSFGYNWKLF
jgi:hypothetical protein